MPKIPKSMSVREVLASTEYSVGEKLNYLRHKTITIPAWAGPAGLSSEYDCKKHPIMDKALYPDVRNDNGIQLVTRIPLNFQKLATKRMVELVTGIPVKRIYNAENERQQEVAGYLEKIFKAVRIDSENGQRLINYFAGCEVMTLWFAVEQPNDKYGFHSDVKLRCRHFTPMDGDELYPHFDEYGDMTALSVGYQRKVDDRYVDYFDVYTAEQHVKYSNANGEWAEEINEQISVMKIPAVYMHRSTPVWEDTSPLVYEMEWSLSRNGNYLRENSRPLLTISSEEIIEYGDAPTAAEESGAAGDTTNTGGFKDILQLPKGSVAQYVTWAQATENLKFHIETLRSLYFTQLQLPDWSYEKMSQQALSGESRKQLFVDAQLKVKDEQGAIIKFLDREVNVVKAFLKIMLGERYAKDIDALQVENEVTAYTITDETDTINQLLAANGNKPMVSQRESIEMLGWSIDTEKTMQELQSQDMNDIMNMAE